MDRFIGLSLQNFANITNGFKIQYGQIYSHIKWTESEYMMLFKIQYGQIYSVQENMLKSYFLNLKSNMDRFIDVNALFFINLSVI